MLTAHGRPPGRRHGPANLLSLPVYGPSSLDSFLLLPETAAAYLNRLVPLPFCAPTPITQVGALSVLCAATETLQVHQSKKNN
jgi:hypothetical protein